MNAQEAQAQAIRGLEQPAPASSKTQETQSQETEVDEQMPASIGRPIVGSSDNSGIAGPSDSSGMFNRDYRILVGWVVLIAVILLIKSTKFGYTLIYYSLLLLLVFLIVTQYQFFDWALAPFRQLGAGFTFGAQDTNEPSSKGQSDSGANQ